jgi:hypothetical protein
VSKDRRRTIDRADRARPKVAEAVARGSEAGEGAVAHQGHPGEAGARAGGQGPARGQGGGQGGGRAASNVAREERGASRPRDRKSRESRGARSHTHALHPRGNVVGERK